MLVEKTIKETEKTHKHTEVYKDGVFLGYYMKNDSKFAAVNENWNFVSKCFLPNFYKKTKKEILEHLQNLTK